MKNLSRRAFLKLSGAALLAAGLTGTLTACGGGKDVGAIFPTSIFIFFPFREAFLCNGNRKFFNLRCPPSSPDAVCSFPYQWEAANPVKQASQLCAIAHVRLHFLCNPEPLRQRNGIPKCFIAWAVCRFVLFALGVRPFPNVCPSVRIALQAFTLCWCQPANDPSCFLPGKHCLLVPAR